MTEAAVREESNSLRQGSVEAVRKNETTKYQQGFIRIVLFQRYPFLIGLFIRVGVCLICPALFDHQGVVGGVQYTDIDYYVFTDAARLVQEGRSPYERHTYRYTPFLADLLALFGTSMPIASRILFCVADALCGYVILKLRCRLRRNYYYSKNNNTNNSDATSVILLVPSDSLWWLYNPLPINICTRGSAESLIVLLPVLLCVAVATWQWREPRGITHRSSTTTSPEEEGIRNDLSKRGHQRMVLLQSMVCGFLLGIAIHLKIYPIIYTLSFMTYFSQKQDAPCWQQQQQQQQLAHTTSTPLLLHSSTATTVQLFISTWIRRLLRPPSIVFFLCTVGMCSALTLLAVKMHGMEAWDQGIAYHITRVDHRHNYSVYWYWIYLLRAAQAKKSTTTTTTMMATTAISSTLDNTNDTIFGIWSRVLFLPQIILLLTSSIRMAPLHFELTLFCQTFLFVACNKVITGQYFTWYLVLLPLCCCCCSEENWMKRPSSIVGFLIFGISIVTWLASAYCLEMLGWPVHLQVWMASLFFFMASVNLFGIIVHGCSSSSGKKDFLDMQQQQQQDQNVVVVAKQKNS